MNSMNWKFLSPLAVALLTVSQASAADFAIKDGDRVVFLGDSITEQRLYTTYIEAYALTRHPSWKLSFRNVGWGGDTAWLRQRAHPNEGQLFAAKDDELQKMVTESVANGLGRDVLPLKPTVVTVKFGMNDHAYQPFRPDIFRAYAASQTEISKVLGASGARVTFLTPQPIEDKRPDPQKDVRNESLRKFSDGLKEVATKTGAGFVDQFDPYMTIMLKERGVSPDRTIGGGDAVHPGPPGQTVMAWAVLKGMGATALVSKADISATTLKASATEGCSVEKITKIEGGVAFDRLDKALPMPIDERAESALKLAPILDELDRLELRVTDLPAGNYNVTIDGEAAGKVSAEDLAKGWNLANAPSPIRKQARDVLQQIVTKNNLFFHRWREVQLFAFPDWSKGSELETKRTAEVARLDQEITKLEVQLDAARQPKSHHFEVKLATP